MVTRTINGRKSILYHAPAVTMGQAWENARAAMQALHSLVATPSRSEMLQWGWKLELISLCVETPIPNAQEEDDDPQDPQLGDVDAERKTAQ